MGEKNEPKPAPQNSVPQLPKVPENRIVHGENRPPNVIAGHGPLDKR